MILQTLAPQEEIAAFIAAWMFVVVVVILVFAIGLWGGKR